jgi:hypothetical protein
MIGYHSVHLDPEASEPQNYWTDGDSLAFVRDITRGLLPEEYGTCDLLYADLPWRSGYERYQARACATGGPTWGRFMANVSHKIAAWRKPAVMVTGAHARSHLPPAAQELPVRMPVAGNQPAIAYVYNAGFSPQWVDTEGLLTYLAERFGRVGDFCAGYGRAPRAFRRTGGTFVASDINPQCVGYIATHASEWRPLDA